MGGVVLRLDGPRWREHLQTVSGATPGMVPVIKGNGYGYGLRRLAEESTNLGVDVIAVGTARRSPLVRESFAGDVVILNPWDRASPLAAELTSDPRVITTVSRLDDLAATECRCGSPSGAGRGADLDAPARHRRC